ncbi:hypothetical protein HNV11_13940 [Spirosoma taeanense]|uniref:Uncharacterized protein n=1 Tax=Spirosoma taeanense TaxID=2735870 RepID=A0A6M5YAS7_9BACT|nr:hypothetical protein [Spirosoma taeanense]QJW90400.1 hypothetical protein HNV11_13940 [Spirosoma taeanense]
MFKRLEIRYQTARSLPAPYAYFYTLTLKPVADSRLQVDLAISYPDREDIDDDELIAEGYSRDDDFSWSGQLPQTWQQTVDELAKKTRLQPFREDQLGEDDDYWDARIETTEGVKQGRPANAEDWQYLVQELIQAAYETAGRERVFELTYLDLSQDGHNLELQLSASFANRTINVRSVQNQQNRSKTLPWSALQRIMTEVYNHDYDPDEAQTKRPKHDGQWLNLGTDEWHDISELRSLTSLLRGL